MGKCLACDGEIPDGTTFCGIHSFDPGQTTKSHDEVRGGGPAPDRGGGPAEDRTEGPAEDRTIA
jgi:hypothetical protein